MATTVLEMLGAGFVFVLAGCVAVWLGRARLHLPSEADHQADGADHSSVG